MVVTIFGQIEIESVCYTNSSWTVLSLPKYYMVRSEAEVDIIYWGWQTGSLSAIWPKVSCTICYIIHNLPKLLQSVSEHHWMYNIDILNTNTENIAELVLSNNHSLTHSPRLYSILDLVHSIYWTGLLTKTKSVNKNVEHNIVWYFFMVCNKSNN